MAKVKKIIEDKSVIFDRPLEQVMHESMMPYAESVILDRAIPRVEDGLKPVQRRILYSMYELGTTPDKQHRKCARIVGDCLGKYHPHGDSSVYGALVFMAQQHNMRKVLVDGHGNFGSVDGDGAAAMRYTEARLTPLAMELLKDIDKDTVDMQWNFDDTCKEPVTLPGHFPNLLVNGCPYGIAVGLATSIPPHNLNEVIDGTVALIDRPKMSLKELMEYIKAPDFPTGGTIICGDDLIAAYETGKGKVTMRAKIHIEEAENDKKNIVITELPFQVVKAKLLQQILKLREDKKDVLAGISDIVDESDRNGMRAVIKVRKDADAEKIVRILLKSTNLECNFSMNMVAIADGKPKQMGLIEILTYYINYQREVIVRRATFDLKAAKIRAEIVEGLLIAIANIDEVIRIIKAAKTVSEASENLRARFALSERQAQAILEMKLRRLTGLDVDTLKAELAELKKQIEELTELLASKRKQNAYMKEEMLAVKKAYKTPRASVIVEEGKEQVIEVTSEDDSAYREAVLILNENGGIKAVPTRSFAMSPRTVSEANEYTTVRQAIPVNNRQTIVAFSNLGNCYKLSLDDMPEKKWKDKGAPIASLSKDASAKERLIAVFASESFPTGETLSYTKQGFVKRTSWLDLNVSKSAYKVMNLSDGDEVINVETIRENEVIFTATEGGMCLVYPVDEVPVQGRIAGGVRSIKLNDGDAVVQAKQIGEEGEIVVFTDAGFAKRVFAFSFEPSKRYNKGVKLVDLAAGAKVAFSDYVTEPYDVLVTEGDNSTGYNTEQIPIDSRTSRGKQLVKAVKPVTVCRHVVDIAK